MLPYTLGGFWTSALVCWCVKVVEIPSYISLFANVVLILKLLLVEHTRFPLCLIFTVFLDGTQFSEAVFNQIALVNKFQVKNK